MLVFIIHLATSLLYFIRFFFWMSYVYKDFFSYTFFRYYHIIIVLFLIVSKPLLTLTYAFPDIDSDIFMSWILKHWYWYVPFYCQKKKVFYSYPDLDGINFLFATLLPVPILVCIIRHVLCCYKLLMSSLKSDSGIKHYIFLLLYFNTRWYPGINICYRSVATLTCLPMWWIILLMA